MSEKDDLSPAEERAILDAARKIKTHMRGYCILMPRIGGGRGVHVTGVLSRQADPPLPFDPRETLKQTG